MLKFAIKSALLGSTVYYTVDKGVWKDSNTTSKLYDDIDESLCPYIEEAKKQIPFELPSLPNSEKVSYLTMHYWNTGVKATFKFLVDLPSNSQRWACSGYTYITKAINMEQTPAAPAVDKK